jgi:hypothetical protein
MILPNTKFSKMNYSDIKNYYHLHKYIISTNTEVTVLKSSSRFHNVAFKGEILYLKLTSAFSRGEEVLAYRIGKLNVCKNICS